MKGFSYYLKVWREVVKASLYKSRFTHIESIARLFRAFIILGVRIIFILALFSRSKPIAGWGMTDYFLLVGVFDIVNYLGWGLFSVNLWRLEEKLLKGEFDFALINPTGSLFASVLNELFIDDLLPILSGVLLIAYWVVQRGTELTFTGAVGGLICVIAALMIWFALQLFIATLNFYSNQNGLLQFIKALSAIASYPSELFGAAMSFLFYTFLPLAFIAVVPARVLLGVYDWSFVVFAFLIALISLSISTVFWNFSVRRYVSSGG